MADRGDRRVAILSALRGELKRQDVSSVDVDALAAAVDKALGGWEPPDVDELSKETDELNAANDG